MQQSHARRCHSKCSSSTITLVEAGMSDTLLGNQARAGCGGDNEGLRSAVSLSAYLVSLQNAAQLPRGEVLRKLSSPALGQEFGQSPEPSLSSAGDSDFLIILRPSFKKKTPRNKGFLELFLGTSLNRSSENEVLSPEETSS